MALVITLAVGVASRKLVSPLPYWLKQAGDILWAMAIYWTIALIRPAWSWRVIGPLALGIAWVSELQQLIDAPWIKPLRKLPVLMVLGSRFSWVDMAMYPLGVLAAVGLDRMLLARRRDVPGPAAVR